MGARRSLACPHCGACRVTKAVGHQRLMCEGCGQYFRASDAKPWEGPEPASGDGSRTPAPSPVPGLGGVRLLAPVKLKLPRGGLATPRAPDGAGQAAPSQVASSEPPAPGSSAQASPPGGPSATVPGEGAPGPSPLPRRSAVPWRRPS